LDVLPAGHGDSLIVTYGPPGQRYRILIDGGPATAYAAGLRAHLSGLDPDERTFELVIVSHVDADHIDGALILLRDTALGLRMGDIWFNGWPQISGTAIPKEHDRGGLQGEFLTELLQDMTWNTTFSGGPAVRNLDLRAQLPGGAELVVLSPTAAELDVLKKDWVATVTKAGFKPGDSAAVAERLASRKRYEPPVERGEEDEAQRGPSKLGSDRAPANGSSIAVMLEVEGKRVLLGADAHARVLTDGLQQLAARYGTATLDVDLFKLPHHGSAGNLTRELLELMRCDQYVVSTNGSYFHHPDPEAIEVLGRPGAAELPTVHFNYLSDTTRRWADPAEQTRVGIRSAYGTDGRLTIEL
jgi:hypothetical protein